MLSSFIGVLLVLAVMLDMFWTTLTTRGSGLATMVISRGLQRMMPPLRQLFGSRIPLVVAGPTTLLVLGVFWIGTLWGGWVLIFSGLHQGVVNAQTQMPANVSELVYYVGFTLSTLGVGDFQPQGTAARVLTALAAFNGLALVTLIITYALPVVSAAISRRQVAFSISMLGQSPIAVLDNTWNGTDFHLLETTLDRLEMPLIQSTEQRLAYPVVDGFFSQDASLSLHLQLAILDEALTLASTGLAEHCQPEHFTIERARKVIAYYLASSPSASRHPDVPRLSNAALQDWARRTTGISVRSPIEFEAQLAQLSERRRTLHLLVLRDGWHWDEVHETTS